MRGQTKDIRIFNRDTIKFAAIAVMAVGHLVGYFPFILQFISDEEARRGVLFALINFADFAPPIFFFFISEGFCRTRSRRKYLLRLLAFTFISQVPYCLMKYETLTLSNFFGNWNVIATLFLGALGLFVWNTKMNVLISKFRVLVKALLVILIDAVTMLIRSEWTLFGVPMILGFHIFREKAKARFIWFFSLVTLQQVIYFVNCGLDISEMLRKGYPIQAAALLLGYFAVTKLYNGQKGKHPNFSKWFFYIFYPAHMLVIWLFRKVLKVR